MINTNLTVVPGYQEMLDLVAEAARRYLPKEPKIIDLGCGTGNASSVILNRISAKIFLIDGSGRMVNAAAEKIREKARTRSRAPGWRTSPEMIGMRDWATQRSML